VPELDARRYFDLREVRARWKSVVDTDIGHGDVVGALCTYET